MHQKEIAFTLERITPIEEEIMPVVPLEVFISYAHEDQALKDELCAHLSNLQRQGLITTWHDGKIVAGTEWEQQIIEHLTSAHLILLLISSDFMASALTQPQTISGLGGIGKTQIALEYAYRHRQTYRAILWMQADTREALILGFISLANLLQLPHKDAQDQNVIVEAVKHWLETHERWLLILDNADDLMLLDEFLPTRSAGHMLLTTRAQAQGLLAHAIEVEQMEPAEAALLLLRRAKVLTPDAPLEEATPAEQAAAKEGALLLGGLPLALDQAGAYIEETGCGVSGYLKRYHADRFSLLQRRGSQVKDHPEPVATTWSLSFEKIEQSHPAAADLLRLCAFFHPDNIPEEFFSEGAPSFMPSLKSLAGNLIALDEAIEALRTYSLIRRHPETNTLSIHRLVQAVLKDAMEKAHQPLCAKRAISTVSQVFPIATVDNWPVCERYVLHAQSCVSLISQCNFTFEATSLLYLTGSYLQDRLEYEEAERLYQHALSIEEQVHGADHPDTATSLNNLAGLYHTQGKYAEAEPLYQRALTICEQVLGANHLATAPSLNNLASLYRAQGKYAEAEPLYQRTVTISSQEIGANHPAMARSLSNLASLYRAQGKYAEAEPLYQRSLAIYEQVLGTDHPNTTTIRNNYATLLWQMQQRS